MSRAAEHVYLEIQKLSPHTDLQRSLQARAMQISNDLARSRFLLFVESENLIPMPFLAILAFWLVIIFASFSLFFPSERYSPHLPFAVCVIGGVRNWRRSCGTRSHAVRWWISGARTWGAVDTEAISPKPLIRAASPTIACAEARMRTPLAFFFATFLTTSVLAQPQPQNNQTVNVGPWSIATTQGRKIR
jgi:hypothetical protein